MSTKGRILEYILITLSLPVMVWMELNEASRDISLALTGGKYEGYGRINRRRWRDDDEDGDDPDPDWLRPPDSPTDSFQNSFWRAKRLKYLTKKTDDQGNVHLVLTDIGRTRVFKRFPLLKLALKPWKGWWLVVTFDIPEVDKTIRNFIRRQLLNIGFAQWQKSVYVCPHDVADELSKILREHNLADKVVPMIARRILAGSDWEFARRIFHIDDIESEYRRVAEALTPPPAPEPKHRDYLRRQLHAFIETVKSDPFLPAGLAPKEGYGREAALAALQKYAAAINSALVV